MPKTDLIDFDVVNNARMFFSGLIKMIYNLGKNRNKSVTIADNDMQTHMVII